MRKALTSPWLYHALALGMLMLAGLGLFGRLRVEVVTPGNGDQAAYLELAANLREGRGFVSDRLIPFRPPPEITHLEGIRAPLYPMLLMPAVDRTTGSFDRAKLLTLAMSLLGAAAFYLALARAMSPAVALAALGLLLSNAHFIVFASELWCENLLLFLSFFAVLLWWRRQAPWAAGVLFALALLAKKVMLPLTILLWAATLLLAIRADPLERRRRFGWLLRAALAMAAVLAPFVAVNVQEEGGPFNNLVLGAAFWIDSGPRDFWRVYDETPSMRAYIERHGFGHIAAKLAGDAPRQLRNFAALGRTISPAGLLPLGGLLWALALYAAWRTRRAHGAALLGIGLCAAFLFASFTWYAHIDVDPRFVWVLSPILLAGGAAGAADLWNRTRLRRWSPPAATVLGVLLLANLAAPVRTGNLDVRPIPPDSQEILMALTASVPETEVLCTGPSHAYPYLWMRQQRAIFVPSSPRLEDLQSHMRRFNSRYLLLDRGTLTRWRTLFEPNILPDGTLPGYTLISKSRRTPLAYVLYRINDETAPPGGAGSEGRHD